MTLPLIKPHFSLSEFNQLFPLEKGQVVTAGGKRPGLTAGLARYTVTAGKDGRTHVIELGYGTVPTRSQKPKSYPLLLPKLDAQLGRFNIDGNTNNVLILRFREEGGQFCLIDFRNFNAPCALGALPGEPGAALAPAVLEIAHLRIKDVLENKLDPKQDPQLLIKLIHHAIEMRAGHLLKHSIG
ncbi:MAG: hypothetical protein H6867_01815 [Rhodospirillales bacterium]|nr:hypothetical protein [Rhodospirillales bacterium]MCB9997254.1 hypothetical protein [Rhodospirillales bacterium]